MPIRRSGDLTQRRLRALLALAALFALAATPGAFVAAAPAVAQGATADRAPGTASTPTDAAMLPLWRALDWFRGDWRGTEDGILGRGRSLRCVSDLFGGRFMLARTHSRLDPQVRQDEVGDLDYWQVFARDPDSGRITVDQYESGGYQRRFALDAAASRPDRFVFLATDLGDASTRRSARLTLRIRSETRFDEVLELADAGQELRRVRRERWARLRRDDALCADAPDTLPTP